MSNLDPKKVWSYNERVWACARVAELEAEKCVLIDQQREAKNILIDKNFHIDSLYEKGYKLQQRIAELEAAQRWIPVSEPPKECEMRVFKDGDAWCFVLPDFQDLQVSPSVWMKKGVLDKIYKELRSVRDE